METSLEAAARAAAAAWVWIPPSARTAQAEGALVVAHPESFDAPTQVLRTDSTAPVPDLVAEVGARVRELGRGGARWWVDDATRPAGLERWLVERCGPPAEVVDVLALDLAPGPPALDVPADVRVERVTGRDGARAWALADSAAWGAPLRDGDADADADGAGEPDPQGEARVVAWVDGSPVGLGGVTVVGPVARLWGAAVAPARRGRGAYRAVLHERLRLAHARGARFALVKGRVETSAPVLRRAGFVAVGQQRGYDVALPPT